MTPRRRAQWAWAMFGWANHSFSTTILVGFFPIFLARYWGRDLPGTESTFWLGMANSGASLVVMLLAPWLGALADRRGQKKRWLAVFTAVGIAGSGALALVPAGEWGWALGVFALASIGFFGGSSFQDALIVQVASPAEVNRVSALGFALGYVGGGLLFLFNVVLAQHPRWFGVADAVAATRIAFALVAAWWALFAVPLFLHVPEAPPVAEESGWAELWATLKSVIQDRPVFTFLLAYWLYIDGIGTVQLMAVDFGAKLGFATDALIKALLMVQFIAFPAAWAFGPLGDRFGARRMIHIGLAVFIVTTLWAATMTTERDFYVLAAVVGLVQGGVQALSRSFFARLIPRERAGEYFGFYNMLGKFAAVLGPAAIAVVAVATGNQRLSIPVLALFFAGGMILLARVPELARDRGASAAR